MNSDALNYSGDRGAFWSSTVVSGSQAYRLYFFSTYVDPAYSSNRYSGRTVR